MNTEPKMPWTLQLAELCESSAAVRSDEPWTRQQAAVELRRLYERVAELDSALDVARDALSKYTSPGELGGRVPIESAAISTIDAARSKERLIIPDDFVEQCGKRGMDLS